MQSSAVLPTEAMMHYAGTRILLYSTLFSVRTTCANPVILFYLAKINVAFDSGFFSENLLGILTAILIRGAVS